MCYDTSVKVLTKPMKKISWILLPVLSFFVVACTAPTTNTIPGPSEVKNEETSNELSDIQKIQDIHWVSSHEENTTDFAAYRKDDYSFPRSRGPRCGFTIKENGEFIHESIHPADAGCIEQKGTWKSSSTDEIQIDLETTKFEQFKYDARSYSMTYQIDGDILKVKTTNDNK